MTLAHIAVARMGPVTGGGITPTLPADHTYRVLAGLLAADATSQCARSTLPIGQRITDLLSQLVARAHVLLDRSGMAAAHLVVPHVEADAPTMHPQPPPPPPPSVDTEPLRFLPPRIYVNADDPATPSVQPLFANEPTQTRDATPGTPTSWLPIAGYLARLRGYRLRGDIASRISALLDEIGITRTQWLLLGLLAPIATAFLIQVVVTILGD